MLIIVLDVASGVEQAAAAFEGDGGEMVDVGD